MDISGQILSGPRIVFDRKAVNMVQYIIYGATLNAEY